MPTFIYPHLMHLQRPASLRCLAAGGPGAWRGDSRSGCQARRQLRRELLIETQLSAYQLSFSLVCAMVEFLHAYNKDWDIIPDRTMETGLKDR